jgi:hypothetical protein
MATELRGLRATNAQLIGKNLPVPFYGASVFIEEVGPNLYFDVVASCSVG